MNWRCPGRDFAVGWFFQNFLQMCLRETHIRRVEFGKKGLCSTIMSSVLACNVFECLDMDVFIIKSIGAAPVLLTRDRRISVGS